MKMPYELKWNAFIFILHLIPAFRFDIHGFWLFLLRWPGRWSVAAIMRFGIGELRELVYETGIHIFQSSVSVLGNNDLCNAPRRIILLINLQPVILCPVKKDHQIGILF